MFIQKWCDICTYSHIITHEPFTLNFFHWHLRVKSPWWTMTNISGLTHKKYVVAFCFAASKSYHIAPCYIKSPNCTAAESISIIRLSHVYQLISFNVVSICPMPIFFDINPFPVVSWELQLIRINKKQHKILYIFAWFKKKHPPCVFLTSEVGVYPPSPYPKRLRFFSWALWSNATAPCHDNALLANDSGKRVTIWGLKVLADSVNVLT